VLTAVSIPIVLGGFSFLLLSPAAESGPAWNVATSYPDRIVLTWSGDPATTQSITWRTDTTVAVGVVQYAIASPGPGFGVLAVTDTATTERVDALAIEDAGVVANFHSAVITGLVPDTLYAYRVGDGSDWTEWFHFRTASREAKPFSFIYFGDAQNDILSLWSRTIRSSFAEAPDARFMIHAGDLINNAHNDLQWGEWFRAGGWIHAMMPSIPAAGNHEYDPFTPEEEQQDIEHLSLFWRPQFTLPLNGVKGQEESNYYIDYQGARILVLNSNEQREDQAAWLEKVLADNPHPWTIATFHHPIFSSGQERDNPVLRGLWKPMLDRYGVDLVLQGHDHTYARGRTFAAAHNTATGVNARDDATGTVYVVSVSGRKMYNFKKGEWSTYEAQLARKAENTQLFQVIRIAGDTLRYTAYTAVGGVYDAFDLIRRRGAPNRFVERMNANAPTRTFADPPPYPW
jgi:hypothetical protein